MTSVKLINYSSSTADWNYSYIPDPYYMGAEGFELVLDLLEEACGNLYADLDAKL